MKPVSPSCKGCPKAEYKTSVNGSGKACRNLKPIFFLTSTEAIMPRQLNVTPSSLKAADEYLTNLVDVGAYWKVRTKIIAFRADADDKYMKLKFEFKGKVEEKDQGNINFLRNNWMPHMAGQMIYEDDVYDTGETASPATDSGNNQQMGNVEL